MNIRARDRVAKASHLKFLSLIVAMTILAGCASNGKVVPRSQSYKSISYGTVTGTEEVTIGGSRSGVGAYVVSAAAIHDATSRSFLGFLARAFVGSAVGAAAEERVTRTPGMRYTIDTASGRAIEVLSRNIELKKGDCVELIKSRGDVEVRATASGPCAAPVSKT